MAEESSIVYIPDLPDSRDGGYEGSALVRAYPEKVFRWNIREPIHLQLKNSSHADATTVVVHGNGWYFFRCAQWMGCFPNVKHAVILGAKEIQIPFEETAKKLAHISGVSVLHAVPRRACRAYYDESDMVDLPDTKVVVMHGMHPNLREVWARGEGGKVVPKEYTAQQLRDLVQSLLVMAQDTKVVEMRF